MSINVEVKRHNPDTSYPKLMEAESGDIVLFTKRDTGTVVRSSQLHTLGEWDDMWAESRFKDFHGSVTLTTG